MTTLTPGQSALDDQAALDRAQEAEYRELRGKAIVSLAAAGLGMIVSMPLMGGTGGSTSRAASPRPVLMMWMSRVPGCHGANG